MSLRHQEKKYRNSYLLMFFKIDVLKNFTYFTLKISVLESLFNKVTGLRAFL